MESISIGQKPELQKDRIRKFASEKTLQKIDQKAERKIQDAIRSGPITIRERLSELDKEWDIDRVLMLNFSILVFAQLLGARKDRRWPWGPLIQTPFMFMHATLGWCPPSLWFRPLGFRTRHEIQAEREVLLKQLPENH